MYEYVIDLICFSINCNKLPLEKFEQLTFTCKSNAKISSLFKKLTKLLKIECKNKKAFLKFFKK